MAFCTSIHCMDGRIQRPINDYLREHYNTKFVDTVTEPGPIKCLSEPSLTPQIQSIMDRVEISLKHHGSDLIAVSGHHDCAGNPVEKEIQIDQVRKAIQFLDEKYPEVKKIGLWVNEDWQIESIDL